MGAKEKKNRFQWFLYIVCIPVLFTLLLSMVVLSMLGFPVIGKLKTVFHSMYTHGNATNVQKTANQKQTTANQNSNGNLQAAIRQLQSKNQQLNQSNNSDNQEISALQQQVKQLRQQLTAANQVSQTYVDQAKVYAAMQPDQAAKIIQQLPENVALQVLSHLQQTTEAAIFDKMDPKTAANYLAKLAH
ncbi:hypothetical protein LSG31_15820 [Fodinisporobacter ferrooxydans]|uniref:Magnesium transporter MgtE intracellular domain-containing protein n=1 Tax=Fodinisporobacter ferrooxydans TaxID=2901836 RepID=A0ABY4CH72_9BACL|nr:hypothetical protein LSG31_15820 [Alicyclobacillaceae bacterium MYW30-H2]